MRTRAAPILAAVLVVTLSLCPLVPSSPARAGDWSHWRGPLRNGFSPEKDLPEKFRLAKPGKDNFVWAAPFGCSLKSGINFGGFKPSLSKERA